MLPLAIADHAGKTNPGHQLVKVCSGMPTGQVVDGPIWEDMRGISPPFKVSAYQLSWRDE
jgi:hypothetical protein